MTILDFLNKKRYRIEYKIEVGNLVENIMYLGRNFESTFYDKSEFPIRSVPIRKRYLAIIK